MKRTLFACLAVVAALSWAGCDLLEPTNNGDEQPAGDDGAYHDKWANLVNETPHDAVVNGNTLTYGSHTYTVSGAIDFAATDFSTPTASVTFTHIPSGFTEFEAVYKGLLGKSPQGVAAMAPMALEIYARSPETGEKCLQLLCDSDATVSGIIRILKTKLIPSVYSGSSDGYLQRYLPAASLKGAVYTNAYAPTTPFTVETCRSANAPQEKKMSPYGTVYYLYLFAEGWESNRRPVDLFLPLNESLYKVNGMSSLYTQCRDIIGNWAGLK